MRSKYGNFLTIALIVVIVLIVVGLGFLVYGIVSDIQDNKNREEAIAQFDANMGDFENTTEEDTNTNEIVAPNSVNSISNGTEKKKKQYYKDFVMLGYIEIRKTNIKYPILETATAKALEVAVATTYPSNPKLNEPGNVVIAGHNYRNSTMFSKNKDLSTGDKIYITANNGTKLAYIIYEKFETNVSDTTYMTRDTGGEIEISLTTCVANDKSKRLIILARAEHE